MVAGKREAGARTLIALDRSLANTRFSSGRHIHRGFRVCLQHRAEDCGFNLTEYPALQRLGWPVRDAIGVDYPVHPYSIDPHADASPDGGLSRNRLSVCSCGVPRLDGIIVAPGTAGSDRDADPFERPGKRHARTRSLRKKPHPSVYCPGRFGRGWTYPEINFYDVPGAAVPGKRLAKKWPYSVTELRRTNR